MADPFDPAAVLARVPEGYTPGPWHLSADRESITQTSHLTRDVWTIPRTHEDMGLIALAPDLVAALRVAVTDLDATRAEIARLRAGGCARDQGLTQYCAEAAHLASELRKWQTPRGDDALDAVREQWARTHSLATAQAYINGLLHANAHLGTERASVVAWLRAQRDDTYTPPIPVADYQRAANAIERGEHAEEEG